MLGIAHTEIEGYLKQQEYHFAPAFALNKIGTVKTAGTEHIDKLQAVAHKIKVPALGKLGLQKQHWKLGCADISFEPGLEPGIELGLGLGPEMGIRPDLENSSDPLLGLVLGLVLVLPWDFAANN